MLNNFVIVGRIKDLKLEKQMIAVDVPKNLKNEKGEYESDTLKINFSKELYDNINKYCHTGDIIGIKGKIQNNNDLFAEKVSFLQSSK